MIYPLNLLVLFYLLQSKVFIVCQILKHIIFVCTTIIMALVVTFAYIYEVSHLKSQLLYYSHEYILYRIKSKCMRTYSAIHFVCYWMVREGADSKSIHILCTHLIIETSTNRLCLCRSALNCSALLHYY